MLLGFGTVFWFLLGNFAMLRRLKPLQNQAADEVAMVCYPMMDEIG